MLCFVFSLLLLMWEYKSSRILGMGGLATTIPDPQTSFFMNPAVMMGVNSLDLINVEIFVSEDTLSDINEVIKTLGKAGGEEGEEVLNIVKGSFGKLYFVDIFSFPHFTITIRNNVAIGMGLLLHSGFSLSPALPSNLTLKYTGFRTNAQPVMGTSVEVIPKMLRIGASVSPFKIAQRGQVEIRENEFFGKGLSENFPAIYKILNDFGGFINDIFRSKFEPPFSFAFGFGGANAGILFSKDMFSAGFAVRDIFDPIEKTTADIGFGYFDKIYILRYGFGIDFQDIFFTRSEDKNFLKRLHFGSELSTDKPFRRFVSLMFGIGQMQLSFAIELNLKIFSLTLGTYGQELGKDISVSPLRYYFFKLAI